MMAAAMEIAVDFLAQQQQGEGRTAGHAYSFYVDREELLFWGLMAPAT